MLHDLYIDEDLFMYLETTYLASLVSLVGLVSRAQRSFAQSLLLEGDCGH